MTTALEQIKQVIPVIGRWDLSAPDRPIYEAPQPGLDKPFGICVSGVRFVEGEVRVTVTIPNFKSDSKSSGRFLIGYKRPDLDYLLAGIGGKHFAYSLYKYESGTGWQPLVLCGHGDNLLPGKSYNISLHVKGQRLAFKQDNITVFEYLLNSPLTIGQLGLFTWGHERVEFANFSVRQKSGSAFVVMQLTEPYLGLYSDVIKEVAEADRFKLNTYHAGEALGRVVLQDIIRGIEEARVIIAEITPANKNVFYEVGYAHALQKSMILLIDKKGLEDLPFDIKGYRCIAYENTIVGKRHIQRELERHLASILGLEDEIVNAHPPGQSTT